MREMNVIEPNIACKATEHITDMIELVKKLTHKGFTYETEEALYFNTKMFPTYGQLGNQNISEKKQGAREDVYIDKNKKNPTDFVLWFKRVKRFAAHSMHWNSPWGDGFPGWHIECSAMSMKYLGETIDIHTGGIDHIPVHHEDEIAQSEAATGKQFVRFWVHHHFLQVDGKKMSKSLGNFYTIDDIKKKGIDPLSLRLFFFQSHYRQPTNFTWEAVYGTHQTYKKLKNTILHLKKNKKNLIPSTLIIEPYEKRFVDALQNDLQTPIALSVFFDVLKSKLTSDEKLYLLLKFDKVLGLKLNDIEEVNIPEQIIALAQKRQLAKQAKNFDEADRMRKQIEAEGYKIEDKKDNYTLKPIS